MDIRCPKCEGKIQVITERYADYPHQYTVTCPHCGAVVTVMLNVETMKSVGPTETK